MKFYKRLADIFYAPFPNICWKYPPYENTVYLTFDDGPYPPLTRPLLALLKHEQIPATFFLSGESIHRYRHDLEGIDYGGHQLGNHLYHHIPLFGLKTRRLVREINLTDELILKHWNRLVTVFRPPYGVFSPQLFPALQSTSKKLVLWTSMAYDFKWDKGRILKHLYYVVHAGDIVVFHDAPQAEKVLLEVLPPFIQHCRRKGWGFGGIQ